MVQDSQSVTVFRALIVGHVIFYVAAILIGVFASDQFTDKVSDFKWSIHPGLDQSSFVWTSLFVAYFLTWISALVGLWLFWRPARILMLASVAIGFSEPYVMGLGPTVTSHPTADLSSISDMCLGAILVLTFIGSISKRFSSDRSARVVT